MGRATFGEEFRLGSQFDEVRRTLLQEQFADRLEKPLGFWVLPSDRRLPLAFLDRKLGELLSTPFSELSATPGIGQKKIHSLVSLLYRATRDEPPTGGPSAGPDRSMASELASDARPFDPSVVSEALWSDWRDAVRARGIASEQLGRLAPSLQRLPTVIWHAPLGNYLELTVGEIRSLRTHGEKRVRCVLEVFHSVYHTLQTVDGEANLRQVLTSPRILQVQQWIDHRLSQTELPGEEEVRESFVVPLLEQLEIDSGETVHRLAAERLGLAGTPRSVREQARQLGVTRARVYQLLDDCAKVIAVRWPEGRLQLEQLMSHLAKAEEDHSPLRLFFALRDLCFPVKQMEDRISDRRKLDLSAEKENSSADGDGDEMIDTPVAPFHRVPVTPVRTPAESKEVEEVIVHRSSSPDLILHPPLTNSSSGEAVGERKSDEKVRVDGHRLDEPRDSHLRRDPSAVSVGFGASVRAE